MRNIESPSKSELAVRGPEMADGVWKGVQPYVIGHFEPFSQNKFFDPSTPSMRKVDDGEKNKKKKRMVKIEVH